MRRIALSLIIVCWCALSVSSQSLDKAKQYYEEGNYLECAKQVRPLADGGNAEAQLMAAQLFFEGKGVAKNDAQGVKYATMAADQGYERAILYLVADYATKESPKCYPTAKKYADRHPYMMKGNLGWLMAMCLIEGTCGAEKDESAGWKIMEGLDDFDSYLKEDNTAGPYWNYKARDLGKSSVDELAEYYLEQGKTEQYKSVQSYLLRKYDTTEKLKVLADSGSVWAMNKLSWNYYNQKSKDMALYYARKSSAAGSKQGCMMVERLTFNPIKYTRIGVGSKPSQKTSIDSVILDYDEMTINFVFRNPGQFEFPSTWIAIDPSMTIRCNGRYYKMTSTTLPLYPKTRSIKPNEMLRYSVTFRCIPKTATTFDIIEGRDIWSNVQLIK